MRRLIVFLCSTMIFLMLLSGCQKEGNEFTEMELPEPIKVELVVPEGEAIAVSDRVQLEAVVTQQNEYIDDADDVTFEISLEGSIGLEVATTYEGEGKYTAVYQFPVEGIYKVTSHVTARGMHSMPSKQVEVTEK
ncbi:FixH family protein [Paenibacillus gallinarum]|uniref:FixH family protein n=1 Tax=Paenibacillus gallinarum TaxID=2762232 RepID=A0ABR8SXU1_9BACL|nr:FixH family protein [Paenibacillus gallinarum]MBD7968164.1 FixH family protein [Paenibacillus gallinarum]